jgi:hypothetical protein
MRCCCGLFEELRRAGMGKHLRDFWCVATVHRLNLRFSMRVRMNILNPKGPRKLYLMTCRITLASLGWFVLSSLTKRFFSNVFLVVKYA